MRACVRFLVGASLLASAASAPAQTVLRIASAAPEGSVWARDLRAFAREIEVRTNGAVQVKLYLNAVAGDDLAALARLERRQLDGVAGTILCERLAPSLRVLRVLGLFQNRDEGRRVLDQLRPTVDAELRRRGMIATGLTIFGGDILFSRAPVHDYDELKRTRLWIWSLDEVWRWQLSRLGFAVEPLPVEDALAAYESGRIDGFLGQPTAALNYQWSARVRYVTELLLALRAGCVVLAESVFDRLKPEQQDVLRAAGATLGDRFFVTTREADARLLGGLFQHQGVTALPPAAPFRSQFLARVREARAQLPDSLVPQSLILTVQGWLADYRVEPH